jgi:hypothetical protein
MYGGKFSGVGTLIGIFTHYAGLITPGLNGTWIGALSLDHYVALSSLATLAIEIAPSSSDLLIVNNAESTNLTIELIPLLPSSISNSKQIEVIEGIISQPIAAQMLYNYSSLFDVLLNSTVAEITVTFVAGGAGSNYNECIAYCQYGKCSTEGQCICDEGYSGVRCEEFNCNGYGGCLNGGVCTGPSQCNCSK